MSLSSLALAYVSDLVRRETAMLYPPEKGYLVESRLQPLAAEAGLSLEAYVGRVRRDAGEQARVVDALTINETSWFRDNTPFRALATGIVPGLLEHRAERHVRVWSAACSSGQEPYSIAMTLKEHLPHDWTAEIWASDVSPTMVARVAEARYGQVEMNRGLPATSLVKYFTRAGSDWEVVPELREMVRPQVVNLVRELPPLPTFDVVMLRNVLIYFDLEVRRQVLHRVRATLAPDGYLVLGSSETAMDLGPEWVRETCGRLQLHRPACTTSDLLSAKQSAAAHDPTLTATGS
ncbi:CheR family methyltransferase [Nocardioides solisilvae]|uniref:CheR family methyltransferase n=1 Tax=Nocardioides solisilvae TaxID=1542435 RepID=UPI000D744999|nr:protein-glutamate O-methyltransferase CheR [Nocardioides solisilvae]